MKGIVSMEIGGKVRRFHFGTQMWIQLEDVDIKLSNVKEKMVDRMFSTTAQVLYNAATASCLINKEDVDFSMEDVATWIDEIGVSEAVNMITQGMKVLEKNVKALEKSQG